MSEKALKDEQIKSLAELGLRSVFPMKLVPFAAALAPLLNAALERNELVAFVREHGPVLSSIVGMTRRSHGFNQDYGGLDGDERKSAEALSVLLERFGE